MKIKFLFHNIYISAPGRLRSLYFWFGSKCVTDYTTDAYFGKNQTRFVYRDLTDENPERIRHNIIFEPLPRLELGSKR